MLQSPSAWRHLALAALSSALLACHGRAQQTVTIHRDTLGIPHVFATSDGGAFYGAGRASAEDRLVQMLWSRVRYQGRTAEFFGAGTAASPDLYVEYDRAARLFGWQRHALRVIAQMPPEQLDLLQRYADGVNDHMAPFVAAPSTAPPLVQQYGLPLTPWTPVDCLGVWYQFGSMYQGQGTDDAQARKDVDRLRNLGQTNAQIADFFAGNNMMDDATAAVQQSDVSVAKQNAMTAFAQQWGVPTDWQAPLGVYSPSFSEAFAVAGSRVESGGSVLVGLPRVPVRSPNAFCELHMVGRSFNVRGACVPGTPFLIIGATTKCAWSATVVGLDMSDCYRLDVDDVQNPTGYRLDSPSYLPWLEEAPETILVKNAPSVQVTYRRCYWGPVVSDLVDIPGEHYAIKGVPFDRTDTSELTGFLGMYRAQGIPAFYAATEGWRFPSVNLVFAGPNGRIGYTVVGAIPVRVSSQFLPGVYALDGDTVANDWRTFVPHDLRPHVLDPAAGFTYSGNHLPIGSWYPLKALIPGAGDTNRSRIVRDLLTAQQTFSEGYLQSLVANGVAAYSRDIVQLANHLQGAQYAFSPSAQAALATLQPWLQAGASMAAVDPGVAVAHFLNQAIMGSVPQMVPIIPVYGGRQAGMSLWLRETKRWISPPHSQPMAPVDAALVDWLLADAWNGFKSAPNSPVSNPPATWLPWYQSQFLTGSLLRFRTVDGHGPLDTGTIPFGPVISDATSVLADQRSASYNQFVPLRNPDESKSLLALGQSEVRGGPHELDQLALWAQAGLKASPMQLATLQAMGITSTAVHTIP